MEKLAGKFQRPYELIEFPADHQIERNEPFAVVAIIYLNAFTRIGG